MVEFLKCTTTYVEHEGITKESYWILIEFCHLHLVIDWPGLSMMKVHVGIQKIIRLLVE